MGKSVTKFAICIFADEDSLTTPRRIYQVLTDEKAERSDYVRIIDDEGEDYLYPKKNFVFMPFPQEVEKALLQSV
ncbi:MAG: hypothetical protein ACR2N3_01160 [Pyrinomonadaceae bacterium]